MLIEIDSSDYSEMKAAVDMWSVDGVPEMFLTLKFYKSDEVAYCIRVNCKGWDKMLELSKIPLNKVREEYENPSPIGAYKEDIESKDGQRVKKTVDERKVKRTLSLVTAYKPIPNTRV